MCAIMGVSHCISSLSLGCVFLDSSCCYCPRARCPTQQITVLDGSRFCLKEVMLCWRRHYSLFVQGFLSLPKLVAVLLMGGRFSGSQRCCSYLAPWSPPIWKANRVVSCYYFRGLLLFWPFCYLCFQTLIFLATAPLSVTSSSWCETDVCNFVPRPRVLQERSVGDIGTQKRFFPTGEHWGCNFKMESYKLGA